MDKDPPVTPWTEVFRAPTGHEVRTVLQGDEPWFVAGDICAVLGFRMPSDALRWLDDEEKGYAVVRTPGGDQRVSTVNESGLYALIFRSRVDGAKAFRKWVTSEVLPAIRRSGRYEVSPQFPVPRTFSEALELAAGQAREIEAKNQQLAIAEPKAAQADLHRAADGLTTVDDFANEVQDWAKREHGLRVLHKDVWDFLAEIGLIIRGNTIRNNRPTAFGISRGFVKSKNSDYVRRDGTTHTAITSRLTPAGEGWAWDRIYRRIAESGSLRRTAAIDVEGNQV